MKKSLCLTIALILVFTLTAFTVFAGGKEKEKGPKLMKAEDITIGVSIFMAMPFTETIKKGVEDSLKSILKGRAWEVLETARHQFPKETASLEEELVRLSSTGEIKDGINGEQLLWIFRAVGLNVRMKTKIRVHEDGKLKTISESCF